MAPPRASSPTLRELRRVAVAAVRRAGPSVLFAPTLLGCGAKSTGDTGEVTIDPPPSASVVPREPTSASATAHAGAGCEVGPPNVTGCGGAEVKPIGSLAKCGLPAEGDIPPERCKALCGSFETAGCHVFKSRDGEPAIFCQAAHPCLGRRPARSRVGCATATRAAARPVLAHLVRAARMEAASVDAFLELEQDLTRLGAPTALRTACRRAAADEARHARAMDRLIAARAPGRRGARTLRPRRGFGTLRALALHNEREGVVGETWGALLAVYQAEHAAAGDVRDAMARIGREELAHAALSFRLAAWARRRLAPRDVAALDRARAEALARLTASVDAHGTTPLGAAGPDPARDRELGWPDRRAARALVGALHKLTMPARP